VSIETVAGGRVGWRPGMGVVCYAAPGLSLQAAYTHTSINGSSRSVSGSIIVAKLGAYSEGRYRVHDNASGCALL
jgi:hypothetical protein